MHRMIDRPRGRQKVGGVAGKTEGHRDRGKDRQTESQTEGQSCRVGEANKVANICLSTVKGQSKKFVHC